MQQTSGVEGPTGLKPRLVQALALAYLLGVAGTLWDWREHYLGLSVQAPHLLIDVGGLLAIGVLAFTDWERIRGGTLVVFYVLIALVMLILLGPFVGMMVAPRSQLMAAFMRAGMTRSALGLYLPILLLAGWSAWRWLRLAQIRGWRIAAAGGVVIVAIASLWDLYWHQTHPLEMGVSMNMLTIPPHQLILAGFLIGAAGSIVGVVLSTRGASAQPAPVG
jgi:hypothetical protein